MSLAVAADPLAWQTVAAFTDDGTLLGGAWLDGPPPALPATLPVQTVAMPRLDPPPALPGEVWRAAGQCRADCAGPITFRTDGRVLYGVLTLNEGEFAPTAAASALQQATEAAYRAIFALLDRVGQPHLWRVWNYLADINGETDGLERYRQFNIGREDGFLAAGRLAAGHAPAACALGTAGGPLSIAFLAGHAPAVLLENPRQVSAYRYPTDYGPRSPTFSRATLADVAGQEWLFVSGTASIVGHQTVHAGDAAGQTRESLANIAAVLAEANQRTRGLPYHLDDLAYRIYVRDGSHYEAVRRTFAATVRPQAPAVFLQADICRADLLVEIEAQACQTAERS